MFLYKIRESGDDRAIFSIFYRFQTLLQKAQNDQQRRTALLRMPKKFRKRVSITFRLSNLVEEHLSYLWIYFGRLADVCYFRKWIFAKKSPKKVGIQKYHPPCLVDCAISTIIFKFRTRFMLIYENIIVKLLVFGSKNLICG